MHHPHHAVVEGRPPLLVGEILEGAYRAGADRVDERVELAVPALAQLVEHPLDLIRVSGVGYQPERVRASALGEVFRRPVENILRPPNDGHPRAVLGQAARGRESHPATAADHNCRGVLQPEIHGASPRSRSSWARAFRRTRSRPPWRRWT